MKNKQSFINALSTLFWSFGSEPPAEVIWGANDLIDWVEKEFVVKIENRFSEDLDDMHQSYEAVIEEIKEKL